MSIKSPFAQMWARFTKNRIAMIALSVITGFFIIALVFGVMGLLNIHWPHDPNATYLERKLLPPGPSHWLGTDNLGRDVLSRMLHGAYISLTVGFVAVGVALLIGITVGACAGYLGGWVDNLLMRIVDAIICFPAFFLILSAVAMLGPNIWIIVIVIGLVSWTSTARLVRAEFLTLREAEYVRAARSLGQRPFTIILRHILPNAAAPIFVTAILGIPDAIMTEAGLSFLSFGVPPPQATWGNIISDGKSYILDAWWLILFPGLAIFTVCLAFYVVGESLREASQTKS